MQTVLVTDVRYRTALAVIRPLAKAGCRVVAVQARQESPQFPAAFSSRYVSQRVLLDGSVKDENYVHRLLELCKAQESRPVLFPIGADTLAYLDEECLIEMSKGLGICTGCFNGKYPMDPPTVDIRGEYQK